MISRCSWVHLLEAILRGGNSSCKHCFFEFAGLPEVWRVGSIIPAAESKVPPKPGFTSVGITGPERSGYVATTAACSSSSEDGNRDKSADEQDIEKYCQVSERCNTSQEACQDNGKCGVDDRSTRDALNRLDPCCNAEVTIGENGEEVRSDAQD